MANIYQDATRLKLRFPYKGQCTVEALWEIPLSDLDKIYGELSEAHTKTQKHSLLKKQSAADKVTELQIAIIVDVMQTRQAEAEAKEEAIFRTQQKDKIKDLIAKKKEEAVAELPIEQLEAMLAKF